MKWLEKHCPNIFHVGTIEDFLAIPYTDKGKIHPKLCAEYEARLEKSAPTNARLYCMLEEIQYWRDWIHRILLEAIYKDPVCSGLQHTLEQLERWSESFSLEALEVEKVPCVKLFDKQDSPMSTTSETSCPLFLTSSPILTTPSFPWDMLDTYSP